MGQKYPKFQFDYEEDYWRKISDRQRFQRRFLLVIVLLILAVCVLAFFRHWF